MTTLSDKYDKILSSLDGRNDSDRTVQVEESLVKIVVFVLADQYYALYGADTKSILPYEPVTPVPGSPAMISGIINVRGDIESVINLHKTFGLDEKKADDRTRILIAEAGGIRSGIFVDAVIDVVDIPERLIQPPVSTLEEKIAEMVDGELEYSNRMAVLLNLEKIFNRIDQQ